MEVKKTGNQGFFKGVGMKARSNTYILFISFALLLIISILFTQTLTNQVTAAHQNGNIEAIETFVSNNAMQQLVNLSFGLQSRFSSYGFANDTTTNSVEDSLVLLGYNANVLNDAISNKKLNPPNQKQLMGAINKQLTLSYNILSAKKEENKKRTNSLIDSMKHSKPGEEVYNNGVAVQSFLERALQKTLTTNSENADKLSSYNRILSIGAIIAVLLFTTFIIFRQWQQYLLIRELKQAREIAEKSKKAKDDFLANMSHELRTPLNSLIGFGNLLNETSLTGKQKEYADIIISNGYNLLHIVNEVLDFSSIEAGKLKFKKVPFNLKEMLENLETMFSVIIAQKQLSYQWKIDAGVPYWIKGDAHRLMQVLVNLINNAIKFTNEGGVYIGVSKVAENDGDAYTLEFNVKDTGTGIPKEKAAVIFERFEQLEDPTTRQHGGTGLGLSIVKSIVRNMNGDIRVNSKPGAGATFTFTATFEKVDYVSDANSGQEDKVFVDFAGKRALVVEDNRANRILVKHLLLKHKMEVDLVEDGIEALDQLKIEAYDIILMDIQMPRMNGYQAIRSIREELQIGTPAIAMTAYALDNEIKKCFDAGFNEYVSKPVAEADLINKISRFVTFFAEQQSALAEKS